jgi:hypothetical protein
MIPVAVSVWGANPPEFEFPSYGAPGGSEWPSHDGEIPGTEFPSHDESSDEK